MKYKTEIVYPMYETLTKLRSDYNTMVDSLDSEEKKQQAKPILEQARPLYYEMLKEYEDYIKMGETINKLEETVKDKKISNRDELKKSLKAYKKMVREHEDMLYIKYSIQPKSLFRRLALKRKTNKAFGSLKGNVNESKEKSKNIFSRAKSKAVELKNRFKNAYHDVRYGKPVENASEPIDLSNEELDEIEEPINLEKELVK